MSLSPGDKLGPYEILALIGTGGMGEVYRARDPRLNRDVAIKVSQERFSDRFEREARAVAALNHPNICTLYDVGSDYLVMEFIEGESPKGPLPLEEALRIARQIADALEAAHEKGIVHRDLKPANIKLKPDGTVKVLDFGLAQIAQASRPDSGDPAASPTLTISPTRIGMILGTAAYMSPEQARGKPVDRRADIWAFGVLLYELLTGRQSFPGETVSDILAAVLAKEPDLDALPPHARTVIEKCLRKDLRMRWQAIGDVRIALDEGPAAAPTLSARTPWRERAAWISTIAILGALLFFAGSRWNPRPASDPVRFVINPPANTVFSGMANATVPVPQFAVSPDGRAIVFVASTAGGRAMLWMRPLDDVTAHEMPGTENPVDPFWSPDSRWVGFVSEGKLKKTPAAGGPVQMVATAGNPRGASWGPDDTILFASGNTGLFRVASSGGPVTDVTKLDPSRQEGSHRWPFFLPDGRHFLHHIRSGALEYRGIYAGSMDGKTKKRLLPNDSSALYAPPGYLLYLDGDMLLGKPFDPGRLEFSGQPFTIAERVGHSSQGYGAISVSPGGVLAYAGPILHAGRLTWFDRDGTALGSVAAEGDYVDFRLSPDEKQLAASLVDSKNGNVDIWRTDLARGSTSRFTLGPSLNASPVWSPDGTRIVFRTVRKGLAEFYQKSASGGGKEEPVLLEEMQRAVFIEANNSEPTDWSPDGKRLLFSTTTGNSGLWLLPLSSAGGDGKPVKFVDSPGDQIHANFSPDGHFVAYSSNESGRYEVHVQTFPLSDRTWQVSTNGGYEPRWRGDGHEIYYLSEDRKLMAVSVGPGPSFGVPKPLFQTRVLPGVSSLRANYVPSRDGRRFLVNTQIGDPPPNPITVVLNWTAGLR